ncbi:hypothetical protein [Thioflavicoccus mobilis]|uniref:hypothetical protein n=1 Tax=Thioflavicoccus mobilis TaxID=80679 RepID=UPI00030D2CA9|nr:hypothetical protein [Thioflavicoccus mobilis]
MARYIVLNPVRARMGERPQDWPWNSYLATTDQASCPDWLCRDWLLSAFGSTEEAAVAGYKRFVAEGIGQPGPREQLKQQVFLGSDTFVEELSRRVPKDRDLSEVPLAQRRPPAKPLAEYVSLYPDRDQTIAAAYASGGYTLKEISNHFGLHYAGISHIVRATEEAKGKT